jgi:hypothetical protein
LKKKKKKEKEKKKKKKKERGDTEATDTIIHHTSQS